MIKPKVDLSSRDLQKYVGENYQYTEKLLALMGLISRCTEHRPDGTVVTAIAHDVDIRYDKKTKEIIRIWRT